MTGHFSCPLWLFARQYLCVPRLRSERTDCDPTASAKFRPPCTSLEEVPASLLGMAAQINPTWAAISTRHGRNSEVSRSTTTRARSISRARHVGNDTSKTQAPKSSTLHLSQFFREFRQGLVEVGHEPVVGHLENRRLFILVDGDDHLGILHTGQMLNGA
jgi:hypothetical protein